MRSGTTPRVVATTAALEAIAQLVAERGPVIFFESAGCCDGSVPICLPDGEMIISERDVELGEVGGCAVYVDARHAKLWDDVVLSIDVGEGDPDGFSLPAGPGRHFTSNP